MAASPLDPLLFQSLPSELILMITNEVDQATLSSFCRVSKRFNEWARPILYRHPIICQRERLNSFCLAIFSSLKSGSELRLWVRGFEARLHVHLVSQEQLLLSYMLACCEALCSLTLKIPSSDEEGRALDDRIWSVIQKRNLVSLSIPWYEGMNVPSLICQSFPRLRTLDISDCHFEVNSFASQQWRPSATLRSLTLRDPNLNKANLKDLFQYCPQLIRFQLNIHSESTLTSKDIHYLFGFAPRGLIHLGIMVDQYVMDSRNTRDLWTNCLHSAFSVCKTLRSLETQDLFLSDKFLESFGPRLEYLTAISWRYDDEEDLDRYHYALVTKIIIAFVETTFTNLRQLLILDCTKGLIWTAKNRAAVRRLAKGTGISIEIKNSVSRLHF